MVGLFVYRETLDELLQLPIDEAAADCTQPHDLGQKSAGTEHPPASGSLQANRPIHPADCQQVRLRREAVLEAVPLVSGRKM
jgi:hypothetical protein